MQRWTDAGLHIRLAVAVGLLLRAWHYLANHTIWYDESVLLDNVMAKGYARLLGPLDNEVAAPPLFVWLLRTLYVTLGDEPYLWRAVPFAGSVAVLLLTVPLARRTLAPPAAAVAVWLVAVSDNHVWLGCTIKPYIGDAAVTTGLLLFLVSTGGWPSARRLLTLAAAIPFLLCFSYPSAFVVGGLLLALAPVKSVWSARLAWLFAATAAALTFATLYFGPVKAQRVTKLVNEWERYYPPFADPVRLPDWLIVNTFGVFQNAYHPSGIALTLLAPVGAWAFWRTGRRELTVACGATFAMVLTAAAVRSYPYGQNRLMMFAAPVVLLLGVKGLEVLMQQFRRAVWLGMLVVVVCGGLSVYHLIAPWHQPDAQSVHRHIQAHRQPGDVILSDEGNYLYFFHGEVRPLTAGADVPVGGRAWVAMDFFTPPERHFHLDHHMRLLGFERTESAEFFQAGAYLYMKR